MDDTRIPLFMERFHLEKDPDAVVKIAYGHFVREPLRTYARDEVQLYIPSGAMGVPLTGTFAATGGK